VNCSTAISQSLGWRRMAHRRPDSPNLLIVAAALVKGWSFNLAVLKNFFRPAPGRNDKQRPVAGVAMFVQGARR
jgi:hypothetical protein